MAGITPSRVICFVLLAACGALCQQRQEKRAWTSLPDAPSIQVSTQTEIFPTFTNEQLLSLTGGEVGSAATLTPEPEPAKAGRAHQTTFGTLDKEVLVQKDSGDFFEKYLYPSLLKGNMSYHPSTSGSLIGRATYAASRIFVMQDDSGKRRLNTSYLVGVLSLAAMQTAKCPYWRRSASEPFSDFGSNIGNDAGMNLLHEFGPGIQQLVKGHAPKFVSKIEERITHN